LAVGEVATGMSMVTGAAAGEYFSVGLATPAAVALGTAGIGVMMDGISRTGLGIADFVAETADTRGANVIDGDILPSSTGGLLGAAIDKKNGNAFSDTGKIGPAQKMGEKINAGFTFLTSTADYVNTAKSATSTVKILSNEVQQQYNIYDTTKTLTE